jgi:hypothetical protein
MISTATNPSTVCRRCGCHLSGSVVTAYTTLMGQPVRMHERCAVGTPTDRMAAWRPVGVSYVIRRNVMGGTNAIVRQNGRTVHVVSYTTRHSALRAVITGAAWREAMRYGAW